MSHGRTTATGERPFAGKTRDQAFSFEAGHDLRIEREPLADLGQAIESDQFEARDLMRHEGGAA